MTMRRVAEFALVTLAMIATGWLLAWWTVPVVAAAWALTHPSARWVPLAAGVAGTLSWAVLLLLASTPGDVQRVADVAGAAMGIGAAPLLLLTLLYPALLAVAAASLARALVPAPARR